MDTRHRRTAEAITQHTRGFFVVLLFPLLLFSCVNDLKEVRTYTQDDTLPVQVGYDIDVQYNDSGRVKVTLKAPKIEEFGGDKPYTVLSQGVNVKFYDDSLKVHTSMTSNHAIRRERERIMEARNNVVVVNVKGERLNTEHLVWDGLRRRIYTKAAVKITTADQVIMGKGLDSDETFTDYTIDSVTAILTLKDEDNQP
ncbi:MAG: hypothetical protein FD123_2676 [Bacteroidetes bacterium]|nr:MAG: hypothetical protein FD123_2676 [Bacteroidota bacterium]